MKSFPLFSEFVDPCAIELNGTDQKPTALKTQMCIGYLLSRMID